MRGVSPPHIDPAKSSDCQKGSSVAMQQLALGILMVLHLGIVRLAYGKGEVSAVISEFALPT